MSFPTWQMPDDPIFNRIWSAIQREVLSVLAEGIATADMIDSMWIKQFASSKVGPCMLMDTIGLDTVEHIEEHYISEHNLASRYHLDWLKHNYISAGKLGQKSHDNGGLYPSPKQGSLTRIILLNLGLAEPLKNKSMHEILHSGQILELTAERPSVYPVELVGSLYNPDGIDIARSNGRMYWTNMGNPSANDGSIQSANLDGTDVQYVIPPGVVHTPKQLLVDQDTSQLYFCDREGLRVMRSDLEGSNIEILYQSGDWQKEPAKSRDPTYWPVGVTISKKLDKIFWTQKGHPKGNDGRIFSANLQLAEGESASDRSDITLIISGLPECIDLEFDDEEAVLYWTDRGEIPLGNTLNKKHCLGDIPAAEQLLGREIIAQGLGEGIGLRLDREKRCLYVADMTGNLWECSMESGLKKKLFEGTTHAYTGLCFYKV